MTIIARILQRRLKYGATIEEIRFAYGFLRIPRIEGESTEDEKLRYYRAYELFRLIVSAACVLLVTSAVAVWFSQSQINILDDIYRLILTWPPIGRLSNQLMSAYSNELLDWEGVAEIKRCVYGLAIGYLIWTAWLAKAVFDQFSWKDAGSRRFPLLIFISGALVMCVGLWFAPMNSNAILPSFSDTVAIFSLKEMILISGTYYTIGFAIFFSIIRMRTMGRGANIE